MRITSFSAGFATIAAFLLLGSLGCGGGGGSSTGSSTASSSRVVAIKAKDLLYNSITGKLYLSVPDTDPNNGNSVIPVDPATGALGKGIAVGSEPGKMALSDDGKYLYVGLDGAAAVRRINLSTGKADQQFGLGSDMAFGPFYPGDIAVAPGHSDWLAVVRTIPGISPGAHDVVLFVNGTPSPNTPAYYTLASRITFGSSADRLYGYNDETTGYNFYRLAVDSNGITKLDDRGVISGFNTGIGFENGRLYAGSGQIADPETGTLIATLSQKGAICPDAARNRVYVANGVVNATGILYTLYAYDATQFTLVGSRQVQVPATSDGPLAIPDLVTHLVRWGNNGLAFCTADKQAVIVDNAAL